MDAPFIKNPAKVQAIWATVLAMVLAFGIVSNLLAGYYATWMREQRPQTYLVEAERLMNRNDMPGALEQWQKAYERAPDMPDVHKVAGDIQYKLKNWEQAILAYEEAMKLGSAAQGVRTNTLWALVELGRYIEATEFGERSIAEGFTDPIFPRYVAEAYYRAGERAKAIPFLEDALKGYPNDLYLMEHLRQAQVAAGNREQAQAMQERMAEVEATLSALAGGSFY